MSRLRLPSDDDHPEASRRHLEDASVLEASGRVDGAAYLAGYVVECALKSLVCLERFPAGPVPRWRGTEGHDLTRLRSEVITTVSAAGARMARYVGPAVLALHASSIARGWSTEIRYRGLTLDPAVSGAWLGEAMAVYAETVHQMVLDGVL